MGKSSLLWRIKEKAHDEIPHDSNKPEIQAFYIDMELISDEEQFFHRLRELLYTPPGNKIPVCKRRSFRFRQIPFLCSTAAAAKTD